jgi:proteasome accessory factor C
VTAAATDRLSRLLALVPYLVSRQGIPLAEAAAEFGISQAQLVKDLELLFVCGTPGHLPDDLIDVDWDDGNVFLSNADPSRGRCGSTSTRRWPCWWGCGP